MKPYKPRKEPHQIQGASVQVYNDDVNGALKKLKKILEGDNRQKDLARHEFHEKPSVGKKRAKAQARKRQERARNDDMMGGSFRAPTGLKWQKSKRKRRRVLDRANAFAEYARKKS
jgi:ribosomal protein S21